MANEKFNAADPKRVKEAKKKLNSKQQEHLNNMRTLMNSKPGRDILHWLLAECKVHKSVWQPNAAIHRDAGRQEIGHMIMSHMVKADQKMAAQMVAEAYNKEIEGEY